MAVFRYGSSKGALMYNLNHPGFDRDWLDIGANATPQCTSIGSRCPIQGVGKVAYLGYEPMIPREHNNRRSRADCLFPQKLWHPGKQTA